MEPFVAKLVESDLPKTQYSIDLDWAEVRRVLEMEVPQDFRELLEAGGGGVWFDYIAVYVPGSQWGDNNLLDSVYGFGDLEDFWQGGGSPPADPMPEGVRLISWASTAGGEEIYWWVDARESRATYPILIGSEEGLRWERYEMGVAEFLWKIKARQIEPGLFSTFLLDLDGPAFRAYES
ncbi:hypothetical protein [Promicromonospora sp. NPDC057488]|uniref:hypothetical protein n=1 Tax=Promicromonospora sp. NPDC057488 TaxID=3346147 RepID=UPI003671032E